MNNRLLNIFLVVFLTAGCVNAQSQESVQFKNTWERLGDDFQRNYISPGQMEAFEERTLQKTQELFEYMAILSDSTFPLEMRQPVVGMVEGMFEENGSWEGQKLSDYLDNCLNEPQSVLSIESISWKQAYQQTGRKNYAAILNIHPPAGSPTRELWVQLIQKPKQFGKDSVPVWTILFSELK